MNHGSLFSGIGGFDLASEWMGWNNVFHCEIEEFPRKILNHYWPNAISYEDITTTDFTIHNRAIDILTGGFPCQPYSQAGKRLGKEDERHLWPEMLRAIKEIEPCWVVGENVYGIVNWNGGMVFNEVQTDLEDEGYSVQPYVLPACGVNAPHQRYRVWFVAYSEGDDNRKQSGENNFGREIEQRRKPKIRAKLERYGDNGNAANTQEQRLQKRDGEQVCYSPYTAAKRHRSVSQWQDFPTQSPVCSGNDELSAELDGITFPKWRKESIKGYGNAVVPQLVMQIFKAIEEYES